MAHEETSARIAALVDALVVGLVERDTAARLVLLAALAGEHALLLGPPGTAKSELARRLGRCFEGGRTFERLLTRFSVPEELFGPLSIRGLERDEYHRLTEGYMPSATVAFLDEIFKANSAILNALLTLLNEREFDNGVERVRTPLATVVAASNEVPEETELLALQDRFLVRCHVSPLSEDGFQKLLALAPQDFGVPPELRLSAADLAHIAREAQSVELPEGVRRTLGRMRASLDAKGITVSDRRWLKIARLMRVAAYTEGRAAVALSDCALVVHCAWNSPEQEPRVREVCQQTFDDVLVEEPKRLAELAGELEATISREAEGTQPALDPLGNLLFLDERGHRVTEPMLRIHKTDSQSNPLYRPPERMRERHGRDVFTYPELWEKFFAEEPHGLAALERWTEDPNNHVVEERVREAVREPARYPAEHVASRVAQVDRVHADASALLAALEHHLASEAPRLSLWPTQLFRERWRSDMIAARDALRPLVERFAELLRRAQALPTEAP